MTYLLLAIAIITEVTATMLLKMSNGWEKWAFGYGAIFFLYCIRYVVCHGLKKHGNWRRLCHLVGHGYRTYHRCFGGILETNFRHLCRAGYYVNHLRHIAHH